MVAADRNELALLATIPLRLAGLSPSWIPPTRSDFKLKFPSMNVKTGLS